MTVNEIIDKVKRICEENGVSHLYLFGSFAKGTAHERSDVDFILKGVKDIGLIEDKVNEIETLRRIDLFEYDNIKNPVLREAMDKYGKVIY